MKNYLVAYNTPEGAIKTTIIESEDTVSSIIKSVIVDSVEEDEKESTRNWVNDLDDKAGGTIRFLDVLSKTGVATITEIPLGK